MRSQYAFRILIRRVVDLVFPNLMIITKDTVFIKEMQRSTFNKFLKDLQARWSLFVGAFTILFLNRNKTVAHFLGLPEKHHEYNFYLI